MMADAAPTNRSEEIAPLFTRHAPWFRGDSGEALWSTWEEALYSPLPEGWSNVRCISAGVAAAQDPDFLREIVAEFFTGDIRRLTVTIGVLHAVVAAGGEGEFSSLLVATPASGVPSSRLTALSRLVCNAARGLAPAHRLQISTWLQGISGDSPDSANSLLLARLVLVEGDHLPDEMREALAALEDGARASVVGRALDWAPPTAARALASWIALEANVAPGSAAASHLGLAMHRAEARAGSRTAVTELVRLAAGRDRKVARGAAAALLELSKAGVGLAAGELIPAAASLEAGVRRNVAEAVKSQVEADLPVHEGELAAFCQAFSEESDRLVVAALCETLALWSLRENRAPEILLPLTASFVRRMVAAGSFDGGVARVVAFALRAAAEVAAREDIPKFADSTRELLRVMGKPHMERSQANVQSLLAVIGRADPAFFDSIVELGGGLPERTLRALVMAVGKVEGSGSPVLIRLAGAPWCPVEIKRLIQDLRRA
ncbi:MAG: hypothetical protein ICV87_07480 [Gemmatimonadetes bacterium]|nr:hypothetical protein [Gemmatimonadota bacterium]